MKFDFIIGNPPYQDDSVGDQKTYMPPVYHTFIEAVYGLADKVELIHPAKFLFNAGSTPKDWNRKMLSDPHLKVLLYEPDAKRFFPLAQIRGGIAITYHDKTRNFGPIGVFGQTPELNAIASKVSNNESFNSFSSIVITRTAYRLTPKLHEDYPEAIQQLSEGHAFDMSTNIFKSLPQVFSDTLPTDGKNYVRILGRKDNTRIFKYIRQDYVNEVINLFKYKVYLPKANGAGNLGEVLASPVMAEPGVGATETFIGIGIFDTREEAVNTVKYISCKFTRLLLGILKTTQDITPEKWKYVPIQDFTSNSDIDWSKSISEIDQQLYKKYGLDEKEIEFIETHVKEME